MSDIANQARSNPSRTEFIGLIAALMALNAIAIDVMLPALPYMGEALGVANENNRQLVLSVYLLGFGVAQLFFGPLSDRFGRRAPLLIGIVVYLLAAFASVFAQNFETLLFLRLIQGMGAAGTRVIAQSIVRDRFAGRAMAEIMSLVFMVFMIMPVIAPGIGQLLLLTGPWWMIFLFMCALGCMIGIWVFMRLPETLMPENRRPLTIKAVTEGFVIVFSNRMAISYSMAGTFMFGAMFGFLFTSQQIYVDVYELGSLFPVAFGSVAVVMSVSSFLNSRMVAKVGMRKLSHFALSIFVVASAIWWLVSLTGPMPFPVFMFFMVIVMFVFGWTVSNMNALSMEPLGAVAGTASSVFGFVQTVGGSLLGLMTGRMFDGSIVPIAGGYVSLGICAMICVLIAEKGRLFGEGAID